MTNSEGVVVEYALHFMFRATNNQYKYEALLAGLKLEKELIVKHIRVCTDFQLIAGQVIGEYEVRDLIIAKYLDRVWTLMSAR